MVQGVETADMTDDKLRFASLLSGILPGCIIPERNKIIALSARRKREERTTFPHSAQDLQPLSNRGSNRR